jgi:hypothetical protein
MQAKMSHNQEDRDKKLERDANYSTIKSYRLGKYALFVTIIGICVGILAWLFPRQIVQQAATPISPDNNMQGVNETVSAIQTQQYSTRTITTSPISTQNSIALVLTRVPAWTTVPMFTSQPLGLPPGSSFTAQNSLGQKWQVRVVRTETAQTIKASFNNDIEKAAGRFAIVHFNVTNRGLSPDTFLSGSFLYIQDASGQRFEENSVAAFMVQTALNANLCADINPDASATCIGVYDISNQSDYYLLVPSIIADPETPNVLITIP